MPHQCLKCGSVFADGSPQILRGCPGCGGTRFFYTDKPITDEERNRLKEQANKDIKHLIQEMLTGNDTVPIRIDEESLEKEEWVPLGIKSEVGPKETEAQSQSEVEKRIIKSIDDLKFPKEKRLKRFRIVSKGDVQKELQKTAAKEEPHPPKAEEPKKKDKGVAVITIDEEGVYDIDVEKLLENSPIIVKKDGSYMVHLPSVFKKVRKKGSAA
jgi:predicted  nucleic acid-binding Zn-ribbon protein